MARVLVGLAGADHVVCDGYGHRRRSVGGVAGPIADHGDVDLPQEVGPGAILFNLPPPGDDGCLVLKAVTWRWRQSDKIGLLRRLGRPIILRESVFSEDSIGSKATFKTYS